MKVWRHHRLIFYPKNWHILKTKICYYFWSRKSLDPGLDPHWPNKVYPYQYWDQCECTVDPKHCNKNLLLGHFQPFAIRGSGGYLDKIEWRSGIPARVRLVAALEVELHAAQTAAARALTLPRYSAQRCSFSFSCQIPLGLCDQSQVLEQSF